MLVGLSLHTPESSHLKNPGSKRYILLNEYRSSNPDCANIW
jgi:hypothetical protein